MSDSVAVAADFPTDRGWDAPQLGRDSADRGPVPQPVGVARTTQAIEHAPRELAERLFANIKVWSDLGVCGHFIAAEHPDLIAANLRTLMR